MRVVTLSFSAGRQAYPFGVAQAGVHMPGVSRMMVMPEQNGASHSAQHPQWALFGPTFQGGTRIKPPTVNHASFNHAIDRCCTSRGWSVIGKGIKTFLATAGLYSAHLLLKRGKPPQPGMAWLA